jgi:hypothetical protein
MNAFRISMRTLMFACVLLATMPLTLEAAAGPYFAVGFEQHGRAIPIIDHQVKLDKQAFTLILRLLGLNRDRNLDGLTSNPPPSACPETSA